MLGSATRRLAFHVILFETEHAQEIVSVSRMENDRKPDIRLGFPPIAQDAENAAAAATLEQARSRITSLSDWAIVPKMLKIRRIRGYTSPTQNLRFGGLPL
jgi:hypothetical protein